MQKQRHTGVGWLSSTTGAGLILVALAHPVLADRATVALVVGLIAITVAIAGTARQGSAQALPRPVGALAILWLVAMLASAATHDVWHPSALLPPVLAVALIWLGGRLAATGQQQPVITSIVIAAVIVAIHAGLQHFGLDPLSRLDDFPKRAVGPFLNPNHLGSLVACVLPLALSAYLILCDRDVQHPWTLRLGLGAAVVAIYSSLLLAGSRGAIWAALAGSLVVLACFARTLALRTRWPAWLPLVVLAMSLMGVTRLLQERAIMEGPAGKVSVGERLQALSNMTGEAAQTDLTVLHRRILWRAALQVFVQDPVLGAGPGSYQQAGAAILDGMPEDPIVVLLQRLHRLEVPRFAHNEWLHSLAETGIAGTLPWSLLVMFWALTGLLGAWRESTTIQRGALGACAAVLVHGLVSYPLYLPATAGIFWILLGISIYCGRRPTRITI